MSRRAALAALALIASGCMFRKRPAPPLSEAEPRAAESPAAPKLVAFSTAVVSEAHPVIERAVAPVPAAKRGRKAAKKAAVPALPAAPPVRRVWGLVAVTTSIVSPSQLIGPDVPYSPEYKKLPVFPERLVMHVSWGLLSVGDATMNVERLVMFNGRPAYHVVSEARSNAFCDGFYPVRDLNESWIDAKTLTSLGYAKKLREGSFFRDEWTLYDRDAGRFVSRRINRDGSFAVRAGTIPANVQDVLSSVYYTRAQQLVQGAQVVVDVNTPDNWPLVIKVSERAPLKVPAGLFASVLVEPEMRREGLFVQKGKRLRLWLSDDAQHRPLLMKVEVFFGHVTASLREML